MKDERNERLPGSQTAGVAKFDQLTLDKLNELRHEYVVEKGRYDPFNANPAFVLIHQAHEYGLMQEAYDRAIDREKHVVDIDAVSTKYSLFGVKVVFTHNIAVDDVIFLRK